MKKFFMISVLAMMSMSSAFAGGGTVGSDKEDSNLEREGNRVTVKRNACLAYGGHVSDDDKRYFICTDGKYDGYITSGPAVGPSCNIQVASTKAHIDQYGGVNNEAQFLGAATEALKACLKSAKKLNRAVTVQTIELAKKSCDESGDQGLSQLYRGTCYLKAADLATFILGE